MKLFAIAMLAMGSSGFIFCALLAIVNAILGISREANIGAISRQCFTAAMSFAVSMTALLYLLGVIK